MFHLFSPGARQAITSVEVEVYMFIERFSAADASRVAWAPPEAMACLRRGPFTPQVWGSSDVGTLLPLLDGLDGVLRAVLGIADRHLVSWHQALQFTRDTVLHLEGDGAGV